MSLSNRQWIYCLYFISMLHLVLSNCKQRSDESGDSESSGESTIHFSVFSFIVLKLCEWVCDRVDQLLDCGTFCRYTMQKKSECNLCIWACCGIITKSCGWWIYDTSLMNVQNVCWFLCGFMKMHTGIPITAVSQGLKPMHLQQRIKVKRRNLLRSVALPKGNLYLT